VVGVGSLDELVIANAARILGRLDPGLNAKSFMPHTSSAALAPSFSGTPRASLSSSGRAARISFGIRATPARASGVGCTLR